MCQCRSRARPLEPQRPCLKPVGLCGLLACTDDVMHVPSFLDALPKNIVGEIQLADYAHPHDIAIAIGIDDHGTPCGQMCDALIGTLCSGLAGCPASLNGTPTCRR